MTPEQAFLADIQADPDNDTPRLIFADWLTDHGDPRGEFIQVQCRLAAMTEDDPEYEDLMDRQGELLVQSRAEWLRPIAELARESHCLFRRGFAEDVRTSPAAFLKHGSGLVQQPPLRWLRTSLGPEPLDKDLAANTLWHHVRGLTLGVPLMANANLALLLGSRHLDRLRGLLVSPISLDEQALEALLRAGHLGRMEELDMASSYGGSPSVLAELLAPGRLPLLHRLDLHGPRSGSISSDILVNARLSRLTDLLLRGNWLRGDDVIRLLTTPDLAGLRRLTLKGMQLSAGYLKRLADVSDPLSLTRLGVSASHADDEDVDALAHCRALSNLHHLDISGTWVTPGGIGELLGSTELASLREIIAAGMDSKVRDSGAARLAGHPGLSRITHLNLDHNDIRSKGALALARSPHTGNLRVLSLRQNPIRSAGLQALAAGNFPGLRELHLGSTKIKQDDLRALLGAPWMRQITHLNLESCGLGTAHARILAEALVSADLRVLQLWYNGIDSEGLTALAASPHLSKLRSLGLGYNSLDVKGLQALASSATFTRLQRLELAGRCASLEEARALAASPHLNRLETLVVAQGAGTEILRERFPGSVPI